MKSTREKVSYCLGLETGRNLQHQFSDLDLDLLRKGFEDGISQLQPALEIEEIQSIMRTLREQVEMQQKKFYSELSERNKKEGEAFLEQNQKEEGVHTLRSGLQYQVIKSGEGKKPTPIDQVSVHYRGSFINGSVFDSSFERGEPQVFPLNRVIPGWSEILQQMRVGDQWKVFIPHYLAYGESGFGHEIGPNTTLIFDMELLGIVE
ncbi:FKBP-type peptidyl-prolyl cis-trans isomerase [Rhabdochlamydiaceae symbiont of Dictyostelium giganteum]|uniref:FKBP-type peptidyl-prolyl cis-trans isomerase n=1 Tax=Rhabdochlamydiaceae symbiont of Dictyostelium giganteum TaxID=3342349 RepID=UPI00384C38CA